jgi:4-amino-4-deoxy-L-arabinose transferase-like glycosyltransferase
MISRSYILARINSKSGHLLDILMISGILLLAAYLRLVNLGTNPGWYSDEGTILEIARHIENGEIQYLAINQSTLLAARLPLFPTIVAGLIRYFDSDMHVLRLFTGSLGIITVGLSYFVIRKALKADGRWLAALTALSLAVFPKAVLYNRLGFSYNLLTPLVLLSLWGCWEYLDQGKKFGLVVAGLAIGIGSISDLMIITLVLPILLVIGARDWHDYLWTIPLLALPFGIYSLFMLLTVPDAYIYDLNFVLFRLGSIPPLVQLPLLVLNFGALSTWDSWLAIGMAGLFLLRPRRWRRLNLLFFLLPIFLLGRATGLSGLGFYYISPLLPFIAMGVASVILSGLPIVYRFFESGFSDLMTRIGLHQSQGFQLWMTKRVKAIVVSISVLLIVFAPLMISGVITNFHVIYGFESPIDAVLIDGVEARQVVNIINDVIDPEDLVIASPALAWAIESHVSDFQITLAVDGKQTEHFPTDIPSDRFAFNPRVNEARFIVVDDIWRNWAAIAMPEVSTLMEQISEWSIFMETGEFVVYENPTK